MEDIERILFEGEKPPPAISSCDHYAGSEKLILKSLEKQKEQNGAFDITCDLEDGASIGKEKSLRDLFCEIINSSKNEFKKIGIRVRPFSHQSGKADLNAILHSCGEKLSHITVPKIQSLKEAKACTDYLSDVFKEKKLKPIPLHFLIETHQSVKEVWEIASLPYLRGLDFGIMDFVSDHLGAIDAHAMKSPLQFEHHLLIRAKTEISAACHAHRIIPVHNVCTAYNDPELTFDDALRAKTRFGFTRMWSIHPSQIEPILNAMKPDPNEVTLAKEILEKARNTQWGPVEHNGKLHDRASYRYYWTLLKGLG